MKETLIRAEKMAEETKDPWQKVRDRQWGKRRVRQLHRWNHTILALLNQTRDYFAKIMKGGMRGGQAVDLSKYLVSDISTHAPAESSVVLPNPLRENVDVSRLP